MSSVLDTDLAKVAAGQHGVVTMEDARAVGLSWRQVHLRARTGRLTQVYPGVYRLPGVPASWYGDVLAACSAAGSGARASHATAAQLMGLERLAPSHKLEVTVLGASRTVVSGTVIHRTVELEPVDVTRVRGIPCTTGARTLIDLAARLDPATLTALTDDALCVQVTARTLVHQRAVHLLPGRPRVQRLIDLTEPGAAGTFRSWLERHASGVFRQAGLPEPEWNVAVYDDQGLIGIVDVLWSPKVIVELEGLGFHSSPSQLGHDRFKLRRFLLAGWIVLPFGWHDLVKRPQVVVEQIRRALGS